MYIKRKKSNEGKCADLRILSSNKIFKIEYSFLIFKKDIYSFFGTAHHVGSYFPDQVLNLYPLQQKP